MTHCSSKYVVQISTPRIQYFSDLPLGSAKVVWKAQESSLIYYISALLFQVVAKTRTYRQESLGH